MLSPAPDQLLRGVADQLEAQVLPELGGGAAQRQLKASLHILRRLERCWDRLPPYLVADAEDMLNTLTQLDLDDAGLRDRIADAAARKTRVDADGWGAPTSELIALHHDLQACVTEADRRLRGRNTAADAERGALYGLYRRMLERETYAWGTEGGNGD